MKKKSTAVSFFAFQDVMTSVVGIFILMILIMVLELANSVESNSASSQVSVQRELVASLEFMRQEVNRLQQQYDGMNDIQVSLSGVNSFNIQQVSEKLEAQLRIFDDRIAQSQTRINALSGALLESQRNHQLIVAESDSMESSRREIERLLEEKAEVLRVSSILETDHPVIYRDQTSEGRHLVVLVLENGAIRLSDAKSGFEHSYQGADRVRSFAGWLDSQELENRHVLLIVKPSGVNDYDDIAEQLEDAGAHYGFDVTAEESGFFLRSQLEVGR